MMEFFYSAVMEGYSSSGGVPYATFYVTTLCISAVCALICRLIERR